jgi:hypothetical protein
LNTKTIEIPSTCRIALATLSRSDDGFPQSVNWNANGHNTYTITLPYGYFKGYMTAPSGQTTFTITAPVGGNSPTLTLDPGAPTGSITPTPQISGPNCDGDGEGNPGDIIVNP